MALNLCFIPPCKQLNDLFESVFLLLSKYSDFEVSIKVGVLDEGIMCVVLDSFQNLIEERTWS